MNFKQASLLEISSGLHNRSFSATELASHYLEYIAASKLNAFITVDKEKTLLEARAADEALARGQTHLLTGIPLAHKDIFCTEGVLTTAGSKILGNFVPPYTATSVAKLNSAGAISLGKANMDEFAMGSSNENSAYGPTLNPWDLGRVPGGSSGGSASAVAAGLCAGATGTDTGGSIRQPASHCGITGIKPTYGRVSRWGIIAYASSLDQAGIMARSAEDAALLLETMSGYDERDSTSVNEPQPEFRKELNLPINGLTAGICREHMQGLDSQSAAVIDQAIKELEKLGVKCVDISLPNSEHAVSAYYVIAPAECSANLSRYDGVRFGYRCSEPENIEDLYKRSRSEGFGDEVRRRILVGSFVLSAGYYDAYYRKAQQIRRLVKQDFQHAFETVDIILGPVSPNPAFRLGEKSSDPVSMYLEDVFTVPVNLAGLPALSAPAGFSNGLPIGLQIIGNYLEEGRILNVAHQYQQVTDWHRQFSPEAMS